MSNQTKMTQNMRDILAMYRAYFPETKVFQFPDTGVTVAITPAEKGFAYVSTAFMADDENKFRKNVGEFLARERYVNDECILVKLSEHNYEYFAGEIANMAYLAN